MLGTAEGDAEGAMVGVESGFFDGNELRLPVGLWLGSADGWELGPEEGGELGRATGCEEGRVDG